MLKGLGAGLPVPRTSTSASLGSSLAWSEGGCGVGWFPAIRGEEARSRGPESEKAVGDPAFEGLQETRPNFKRPAGKVRPQGTWGPGLLGSGVSRVNVRLTPGILGPGSPLKP